MQQSRMVALIRERSLQKSISTLLSPMAFGLKDKLRGRRQLSRLNQKPVDQLAEAA